MHHAWEENNINVRWIAPVGDCDSVWLMFCKDFVMNVHMYHVQHNDLTEMIYLHDDMI